MSTISTCSRENSLTLNSCDLATESFLFPFFFFFSIFFSRHLSSARLAWPFWQHVFSLSLIRTVFFRVFHFHITGSINLYVYVCLILISLHVIELCLCPCLPSLAPVCGCVCMCVSPGTVQVWTIYSCFIVLTLIPMSLHRNHLKLPSHCMSHLCLMCPCSSTYTLSKQRSFLE